MIYSADAKARFLLLNDLDNNIGISLNDFLDFESKFESENLSSVFDLTLWEIADRCSNKLTAQKIYSLIRNEKPLDILRKNQIGLLSVRDEFYPKMLKEKLPDCPQLFYTAGDISIINQPSYSVTGPRNASKNGIEFAYDIGETIAKENRVLVSGGARGCDYIATENAIKSGGKAVWFLATPMIEAIKSVKIKRWIDNGSLCLLYDSNPFGKFSRTQALNRNGYIYASGEVAFVCQCSSKISGTFSGAKNSLKNNLTRLYILDNGDEAEKELINLGAIAIVK